MHGEQGGKQRRLVCWWHTLVQVSLSLLMSTRCSVRIVNRHIVQLEQRQVATATRFLVGGESFSKAF